MRGCFNAVAIESTLERFFEGKPGDRGTFYDADVFRSGLQVDLAFVLARVAYRLSERIARLSLSQVHHRRILLELNSCIYHLHDVADQMMDRKDTEREDYHWELFGGLMSAIMGLLDLADRTPGSGRPN